MNANNLLQTGIFLVVLLALAVPVAGYITRVLDGRSRAIAGRGRRKPGKRAWLPCALFIAHKAYKNFRQERVWP